MYDVPVCFHSQICKKTEILFQRCPKLDCSSLCIYYLCELPSTLYYRMWLSSGGKRYSRIIQSLFNKIILSLSGTSFKARPQTIDSATCVISQKCHKAALLIYSTLPTKLWSYARQFLSLVLAFQYTSKP